MIAEPEIVQETVEETEQEAALEPPWRVFIHNDDVTPYDFVVLILQKVFQLSTLESEHVTFVAHTAGVAYVATYGKSEAQKRVGKAHFAAGLEGYPLTFSMEPES